MTVQGRGTHAAVVAQWKKDQTGRIFNVQSEINALAGQIDLKKTSLADQVYRLHLDSKLDHEELKPLLAELKDLFLKLAEMQSNLETIQAEEPPSPEESSSAMVGEPGTPLENSGLVCPVCDMELVGKFCPKHGAEGVLPEVPELPEGDDPPTLPESVVSTVLPEGKLVCPTCKLPLVGKFCPEHGVSGVPVVRPSQTAVQPEQQEAGKGLVVEVIVCPECGQELVGKFCPEHGVEGIIITK